MDVKVKRKRNPRVAMPPPRGRILNCTTDEYLADPCERPSLSSGVAHALVADSPAHAFAKHPRLGGSVGNYGTKAMNDGALIHTLLLGNGKDIVVIDAPDFRTNLAKDARDSAIALGRIPVLKHQIEAKAEIAEILREKLAAYGYMFQGDSEVAIEWKDDDAGEPVLCRSMLDHVYINDGRIYDVKKVASANPKDIARSFYDWGYDIQFAAYTRALAALRPELEGRIDFTFLFMEIEPPYSVVPVRPDGAFREIGKLRWERSLRLWVECMRADRWPGYSSGVVTLEAPQYLVNQEIGTWQQ